jgi:hypothetical protein
VVLADAKQSQSSGPAMKPEHAFMIFATALFLAASQASAEVDLALFGADAMVAPPETVDCTLTNGEAAQCARLVLKYKPDNLDIGPFCPTTLDEVGGIWDWDGENAGLYRLDGAFWRMLDSVGYSFFDPDGAVHVADPAVADPTVDHACITVGVDDSVEMTVLLPMIPQMADSPTELRVAAKVGVALDGVPIFSAAPSVERTGHLPALDTCGGHVDPGGWYHWHATSTDIETVYAAQAVDADCGLAQSAAAQFAYAFDGHAMFGSTEADGSAPLGLDACNGHTGPTAAHPEGEYHYHATTEFPNLPACLTGVQAEDNFTTTAITGIGSANEGRGPGPGGAPRGRAATEAGQGRPPPPGFDRAAIELGVTLDELWTVVQDSGGPRLDFAQAAAALGVSEAALRAALPPPPPPPNWAPATKRKEIENDVTSWPIRRHTRRSSPAYLCRQCRS